MAPSAHPIVLFLNDWPVRPAGANSGGGEVATVSIARAFKKIAAEVYVCGNLPEGDCVVDGVRYIDFGKRYELHRAITKLSHLKAFHCFAATLAHPFLLLANDSRCLSKVLINHSPGIVSSGLEPATVMEIVDYMACVSEAQRSIILSRYDGAKDRMVVVKNGFDPELFTYAGPQKRNWRRLMYAGRLEPAKGIHILLEAYAKLVVNYPDLELRVFGDESYWPDLAQKIPAISQQFKGISFYGKVPQTRLAAELHEAGILVFPSTSFETAGLSVIDAQASGCPVLASAVGGVPEYLVAGKCGELLPQPTAEKLFELLAGMLSNQARLEEYSRNSQEWGRKHSWNEAARALLALAEKAHGARVKGCEVIEVKSEELRRTLFCGEHPYNRIIDDHEIIATGKVITDPEIDTILEEIPHLAAPYLWKGLRCEVKGDREWAKIWFGRALERSAKDDWQAAFRMLLVLAEESDLERAAPFAKSLIERHPFFPLRDKIEQLMSYSPTGAK